MRSPHQCEAVKLVVFLICLAKPARGRITLRSSAKYLEQLGVRLDRTDTSEPIPSKSSDAASEGLREIAWESDRRFA